MWVRGLTPFFCRWKSSCPRTNCLRDCSFILNGLGTLAKNQLVIDIWVYICILIFNPLIYMYIHMPIPPCFVCCSFVVRFVCFVVSLEIRKCEFSTFVLYQDCSGSLKHLQFHINLRISFPFPFPTFFGCWSFNRDYVESICHFG